jgi:predicted nuclease with TOPRIM domain
MGVLLTHRHQFIDFMETYKEMINRFQSTADEEIKVTNDLIKKVNGISANITMNQNRMNINLDKANKAMNSQEIVTNYQVLNQKLESMNDKINKIESLLVSKLK